MNIFVWLFHTRDTSWLPFFSLCDSCSASLFLFSGTIVILHDLLPYTGWHCGLMYCNILLDPTPLSLISFLRNHL